MRRPILLLVAGAAALSPAAAQAPRYLDPRDVTEAQRQHGEMVQEFGGAETGPRAAYVQAVGQRVGNYSGIASPGQSLHFTLLNSPVENALSVPGGYVYITRQLMTLMDDESQLAFALGHETGHIAANHAHVREQYAQRGDIFGVLGQIVGAVFGVGGIGSALSQQAELRTLSFSRDQEYQADSLSLRYITAAGYNPAGGPGILAALARSSALQARVQGRTNRQTPEWASTHPLSENRSLRALQEARATGRLGRGMLNREQFLAQLNGIYVDDDPAQGVIEGRTFTHPDLRIQFTVPPGYLMSNGTTAVTIRGSAGQAQFSGGRYAGSLDDYILAVIRQVTGGRMQFAVPPPQRTSINGMPAAITSARVNTGSGVVDVSVVAYQWDRDRVYHFVMVTQGGVQIGPFSQMVGSLRRITPAEAAAIRPRIIDVVTVRPGDTVQTLASRMAYRDFQVDRFVTLNGLAANTRLTPGQKVKLVVFGQRRA